MNGRPLCLFCVFCTWRPVQRGDHAFTEVLLCVRACVCVWSRRRRRCLGPNSAITQKKPIYYFSRRYHWELSRPKWLVSVGFRTGDIPCRQRHCHNCVRKILRSIRSAYDVWRGRPHSGLPVVIIEMTPRADNSGPEYCLLIRRMESWQKEFTTNFRILYVWWAPRPIDLRRPYLYHCIRQFCHAFLKFETSEIPASNLFVVVVIIIIVVVVVVVVIGSTALCRSWSPQAHVTSGLYPGQPPANFYNPFSLRLPLPRQSILISVGHVLVDLQRLSIIYFFW